MTGSNDSWKEIIAAFDANIAVYLKQLKLHGNSKHFNATFWDTTESFTITRQVLIAAAGSISHEITKFSMVHTKNPSVEEAQSMCKSLRKPCEQFFSAVKTALFCGVGPSLAASIVQSSIRIFHSLRELTTALQKEEMRRVPELTGRIWDSCKSVEEIPTSNHASFQRNTLETLSMLGDSIKELKECLEATKETDLDLVELEDDFDFDATVSSEDRSAVILGVRILEMFGAILKGGALVLTRVSNALNSASGDNAELIIWTSLLDRQYTQSRNIVIDVSAALYPPIEADDLHTHLQHFSAQVDELFTTFSSQPDISDGTLRLWQKKRAKFQGEFEEFQAQVAALRESM
uniref:Uncharacterized protein AlNc14C46G3704 n=1 Tax=Albugo laibachii Nc14 TaxID=890382 RepID=F0WAH9_9STRA|nr:conserved hypothetical protein [Albugo laibachii Nc14]|eukprot:CCA18150.1 conserved hypothetical protein [Albugo laibachii Nc14]